jgi:integration host factor subunit alpha
MTLTKDHLVQSIKECTGMNKAQSKQILESLFQILKENLCDGEDILISGFGKFSVKDKGSRKGRNPVTGKEKMLDARRVVTFRSSGVLKNKVNGSA